MEKTIDIGKLANLIWRRRRFVAAMFVACFVASILISIIFIRPSYRTGFTAYIGNRTSDDSVQSITNADTNAAQALVYTYAEILKSRDFIEQACADEGLDATYEEVRGAMNISIKSDTQLMEVTFSSHSSQKCKEMADAIAKLAPSYTAEIVDGTSMKIISYPVEVTKPYSPNVKKNGFAGGCIGIVIAIGIVCLMMLLDTKVDDARDLEYKYGVPLLGTIPEFRRDYSGKKRYRYQ